MDSARRPGTGRRDPYRTCVGCRRRRRTSELVRFTYASGRLVEGRALPGRGAWLCAGAPECAERAVRHHGFTRALRVEVTPRAAESVVEAWRER